MADLDETNPNSRRETEEELASFFKERSHSVFSMDVIQDCEELLIKAHSIAEGKEKRLPEEARRYLSLCCDQLEQFVQYKPGDHYVYWLLSYAYFERAKQEKLIAITNTSLMASSSLDTQSSKAGPPSNLLHTYISGFPSSFNDESKLYITKALQRIQQCCQLEDQDEDSYLLWAHILLYLANSSTNPSIASSKSLIDSEQLLLKAADRLLKATQLRKPIHKRTYIMLENVVELLLNGVRGRK
jgi:hypothetical protein